MQLEELTSALTSKYASQLRQLCLDVTRGSGSRIANQWAVNLAGNALSAFQPQSIANKPIDLQAVRNQSLYATAQQWVQRVNSDVGLSMFLTLTGGLPETKIYQAAQIADTAKAELLNRAELEARSLLAIEPQTGSAAQHVEDNFYKIRPMSRSEYEQWLNRFSGLLSTEFDYLIGFADFLAGKTRIPLAGGQVKGKLDSMVNKNLGLNVKPDWRALPKDLQLVKEFLLPAYTADESKTMRQRYHR